MTRTVLITGCSTGFGEAAARLFASRGWNVVATMRRPEAGAGLAALDNVLVTRLDVQDPASIDAAVAEAIARFGRIDVLVNNAGFGLFGVFEAAPRDKIREQFDVNVFGVMDVTRALLPHFRANRSGTIVNISSGAGVFTLPMISLLLRLEIRAGRLLRSPVLRAGATGHRGEDRRARRGHQDQLRRAQRGGGWGPRPTCRTTSPFLEGAMAGLRRAACRARRRHQRGGGRGDLHRRHRRHRTSLRYVATDDIKPLIRARRETSEAEYMAFMREQVTPQID